ncbi:hypothetical protein BpHYR1_033677 [Brachionus plicatilis]|uniref:Uncharacterized protein n=1 Tax=Brachionus plicatilis TaxID=10195 RepID=A0A3M7Q7L6_BRAPC|nr:hypothetical protein BpHYR1_033677 [Brachionus plicatilis]
MSLIFSLSFDFIQTDFNDDQLTMPYQSAAIQERLRQFELNANSAEKKKLPLQQESRLESGRKRSPFESQNKENSPLSNNFNQLGHNHTSLLNQRHTVYQPVSLASSRNEPEPMFPVRSNLSSAKSVSNINLVKVPSMLNSKPLFNVNLTAATAAASEAIKQQQNDFTRIFHSHLEKPELSNEKIGEKSESLKSVISVKQAVDSNNNLVKKSANSEQKNSERANSKSDSSKPSSRRNSPHKSLNKVAISLAPPTPDDVEMVSTASSSSNKENNSDNLNEASNEPSKLSISEKLKLFSGSKSANNPASFGANLTKKPNSVKNSKKINSNLQFKIEIISTIFIKNNHFFSLLQITEYCEFQVPYEQKISFFVTEGAAPPPHLILQLRFFDMSLRCCLLLKFKF